MVECNYGNILFVNEVKVDPELNCKPEILIEDVVCIKTEFESISFGDDANDELLLQRPDENSTSQDPFACEKESSSTNQKSAPLDHSFKAEKKGGSKVLKVKSTFPNQTKTIKPKLPSSEPKRNRYKRMKEVHSSADGFE